MKKKSSLLVLIMLATNMIVNAQTTSYKINGKAGNLSAPAKAYLLYTNTKGDQIDSANMNNGSFVFTGSVDEPKSAFIIINKRGDGPHSPGQSYIALYLEPGNISVFCPESTEKAEVTAGPVNADADKIKILLAPINARREQIFKDYRAGTGFQKKSKEFRDSIERTNDSIQRATRNVYLAFVKANPNAYISIFDLQQYAGPVPDASEIAPLFNSLSLSVRSTKSGTVYAAEIAKMEKTSVGTIAPDFTQADTSGRAISLHDFRGKYVLVDFWASWCGPCRAENPNVAAAYVKYKEQGFTVLGVSLDQTGSNWLKAIHDDHLTWTQISDLKSWKNEVAQLYSVHAIPQNFLIDPNGKIVGKNLRGDDLNNRLKELFDK